VISTEVNAVLTNALEQETQSSGGFVYGTWASALAALSVSLESCHGIVPLYRTEVEYYSIFRSGERAINGVLHSIKPALNPMAWLIYDRKLLLNHFIKCRTLPTFPP
jgi:hypothetical protein